MSIHPQQLVQVLALTLLAATAQARSTETPVSGALAAVENSCLLVSAFYYGVDCSYEGGRPATPPTAPWVGPTLGPMFLPRDDPRTLPGYTPGADEALFSPPLTGSLTIDDRGTAEGMDDLISGQLTVGAAARSHLSRIDEKSPLRRAIESWQQIRHTLAPSAVNQATPNRAGGFDYVIAARGLPPRLCRKAETTDCFPSAAAPLTTDGKWGADTWAVASPLPIGRSPALGANPGTHTTAIIDDYHCADTGAGNICARGITLWSGPEDPGWDNLLLAVSTDASGRVLQAEGYWLNEFRIEAGPAALRGAAGADNSWVGGYLRVTAASAGRTPGE